MQPPKPIDHVALRRLAAETWEVSIRQALQHMVEAEKTNAELSSADDITPTAAAEGRRATHLRMAETYAALASACMKVPGSQF